MNSSKSTSTPRAPTERQLLYARELGISIPAEATLEVVSDLISEQVQGPTSWALKRYMAQRGLSSMRSLEHTLRLLRDHFETPEAWENERLRWYVFNVARHLYGAHWQHPDDPDLPIALESLVSQFQADEKAMASYRRSLPDTWNSLRWPDLIDISSSGTGIESMSTAAYKAARKLIRDQSPMPPRPTPAPSTPIPLDEIVSRPQHRPRTHAPQGNRHTDWTTIAVGLGAVVIVWLAWVFYILR